MPHLRHRHLEPLLQKALDLSPLVGVLGHRQVGKTTLLNKLTPSYHTFDDSKELLAAEADPAAYVASRAGHHVALDECQVLPALFPALKEWVRKKPKPGQFLLSGSVRFTSRKAIRESLTGRILNFELLPMLISELRSEELPSYWRANIAKDVADRDLVFPRSSTKKKTQIEEYLKKGGLPGLCFLREPGFFQKKIDSQLETILDRDLRMVTPTNIPYPQLRQLLQVIADRQGELFAWTDIREKTEISIPTLKKLFYGLEAVFLLRSVLVEGDVRGPVYYLEDLGEASFLRTHTASLPRQLDHFLQLHIRGEMSYGFVPSFRIFQYRTRGGAFVPTVLQVEQNFLGVLPIEGDRPSRSEIASADSFLRRFSRSRVIFPNLGDAVERLGDRKTIVPVSEMV